MCAHATCEIRSTSTWPRLGISRLTKVLKSHQRGSCLRVCVRRYVEYSAMCRNISQGFTSRNCKHVSQLTPYGDRPTLTNHQLLIAFIFGLLIAEDNWLLQNAASVKSLTPCPRDGGRTSFHRFTERRAKFPTATELQVFRSMTDRPSLSLICSLFLENRFEGRKGSSRNSQTCNLFF